MAKAFIIGVGPGDPTWLTDRARAAVAQSDAILGWELNLTPLAGLLDGKQLFIQKPGDYGPVAANAANAIRQSDGTIAIVRIGDALVSSGLNGLLALFHDVAIEIVPGISSVQLAAAAAQINLDEAAIISFHEERRWDEEQAFMRDAFRRGRHLVVLTGPGHHPNDTAAYLLGQGVDPVTEALVGESLALPDERVTQANLAEIATQTFHWLSVMVIIHPTGINPLWKGRKLAQERKEA
ncbi:MAG TPA: precorrin-6y C5,15-methyltransferase (decarboxylating) subunit CbiE [Chloroflexota bacterium]|nr:precorrin-6y C5,15-methyltransferase (decarboxylating) subunit CbiE [Chloroflexota bacterium]